MKVIQNRVVTTIWCSRDELREDNINFGVEGDGVTLVMSSARAKALRDQLCGVFGVPKSALMPDRKSTRLNSSHPY